jgi:hypothetical protein
MGEAKNGLAYFGAASVTNEKSFLTLPTDSKPVIFFQPRPPVPGTRMVDTLRCDEVMSPMRHSTPILDVTLATRDDRVTSYHERLPNFCKAYRDRAILNDQRVFQNLLVSIL